MDQDRTTLGSIQQSENAMNMARCVRFSTLTPKPWNEGCDKAALADKICSMSYLLTLQLF